MYFFTSLSRLLTLQETIGGDNILEVCLGHVVEDTACIVAHRNVGVTIHSPRISPLIAHYPIAFSLITTTTPSVVAAGSAPRLLLISTLFVFFTVIGSGRKRISDHLNAMVHLQERRSATDLRRDNAAIVVLP